MVVKAPPTLQLFNCKNVPVRRLAICLLCKQRDSAGSECRLCIVTSFHLPSQHSTKKPRILIHNSYFNLRNITFRMEMTSRRGLRKCGWDCRPDNLVH